jgi:O-phosphoseryl-tRNA(Sec) selenium transferase, SepSecS
VQSTDKNFLVPVGGAIVTSPDPNFIVQLSKQYPGRASMAPILDLFITLLSMGEDGLLGLWKERHRLLVLMKEKLNAFCASHGERLLMSPNNSISIGVTLDTLSCSEPSKGGDEIEGEKTAGDGLFVGDSSGVDEGLDHDNLVVGIGSGKLSESETCSISDHSSNNLLKGQSISELSLLSSERHLEPNFGTNKSVGIDVPVPVSNPAESVSFLGSMLFQRNVSGCRVVERSDSVTEINGVEFISWGSHIANYPASYFTAACSIGLSEGEIILFIDRLQKTWKKYEKSKIQK